MGNILVVIVTLFVSAECRSHVTFKNVMIVSVHVSVSILNTSPVCLESRLQSVGLGIG